jgi:hypothetical protein
MASKKKRSSAVPPETQQTGVGEGRALQYSDLDAPGQRALNRRMASLGNPSARMAARLKQLDAAAENPDGAADYRAKAGKQAKNLRAIRGETVRAEVTLDAAADRRIEHFANGLARSQAEGVDSGAGWYFGHRGELDRTAAEHGFPEDRIITASAMMSPQNSPENERAAVHAAAGRMAGNEYNAKDLGRSGTKENLGKAEAHLAGGEDSLNPLSSPKVHSYREATAAAAPQSDAHLEYLSRVDQAAKVLSGQHSPGQTRMDLWGLQDSREGLLDPGRNTAEDTWMNSISLGQPFDRTVGRTNVGKAIGSDKVISSIAGKTSRGVAAHPSGEVSKEALQHAWNNEATIRAAERVGLATGTVDSQGRSNLPAVAMQEVAWTEARRVAGKDPEYNREVKAQEKANRPAGRQPSKPGKITGQQEFFPGL